MVIDFEVKRDQNHEPFRNKVADGLKKFGTLVEEHKKGIAVCAVIGIQVVKVATKQHRINAERDLKELYCYDRSLGHYWKLNRKLTNKEWIVINTRKSAGERLADILVDMKVLK